MEESQKTLKVDVMSRWIDTYWLPNFPGQDWLTLWVVNDCLEENVLKRFDADLELPDGWHFAGFEAADTQDFARVSQSNHEGLVTYRAGAFVFRFVRGGRAEHAEDDSPAETLDVLVIGAYYSDDAWWHNITLACMPRAFIVAWTAFAKECNRLSDSLSPTNEVVIIGGRTNTFAPTVGWEEVVLPPRLKDDILEDVESFFTKGIEVYKRLNLKPFRKLLLAGVPGTGKTMICSALAKWALERQYVVIYVSSAVHNPNDDYSSSFGKIQRALSVAANSQCPALILLEELDAYLHEDEKAMVLNVLDGSESSNNDKGTLLIATTNYPEAIDERVLKRPGRLDRIFIIPETRTEADAETMLRRYLGGVWDEAHRALVPDLIGYPGAFIREVAIYALTQMAYDDLTELPLEMLEKSFRGLKEQIEARDDFLNKRAGWQPFNATAAGQTNGKSRL
jgi:hypothetical protein